MRIYARTEVCGFRFANAAWAELSNFYPLAVPIAAGPWTFSTSEAAYQAAKFAAHPDVQRRIAETPTPREAAAIGRTPGLGIDPDWNAQRVDVMRWVLREKREANRVAIDAVLAATGERPIVEVSTRDPWWGARPVADSLRGPQRSRPSLDGAPPTASRRRPGGALRRLDRAHPHRMPRGRHGRRPGGRLNAASPPASNRPVRSPERRQETEGRLGPKRGSGVPEGVRAVPPPFGAPP